MREPREPHWEFQRSDRGGRGSPHFAVAVNTATNNIFVANNASDNVTVIDGITNKTSRLAAGTEPFAIAVDPVTNKIYVVNGGSADVTVMSGE